MRNTLAYFIIALLFLVSSCTKNKYTPEEPPKQIERAILLYMMANNTLDSYIEANVYELVSSYNEQSYENSAVYVYFKGADSTQMPALLKITNNIAPDTLIKYTQHNSASAKVLNQVIDDFKNLTPTASEHGILFSSHGLGWIPSSYYESDTKMALSQNENDFGIVTKCFGQDGNNWFETEELASAIDDDEFDYILFDACLMAGIEIVYSFRNKADYLMASAAEVLGTGYNYNNMAYSLASPYSLQTRLTMVASDYCDKHDYYTISLFDLNKADSFFNNYCSLLSSTEDIIGNCSYTNVQQFGRSYFKGLMFDVVDYIKRLYNADMAMQVKEWCEDMIVYKNSTDAFYVGFSGFDINTYCGMTTYIPFKDYRFLTPLYKETEWYKAIEYVTTDTEGSRE